MSSAAIVTALAHIAAGELFAHHKLMRKLNDRGTGNDVTIAHHLQLNLEAGLFLIRATREKLQRDLEQDRGLPS
jgi:hypothetical protein